MKSVKPTERWNRASIQIPGEGDVSRSYPFTQETLTVSDSAADFLSKRALATITGDAPDPDPPAPPPQPEPVEIAAVSPPPPAPPPEAPPDPVDSPAESGAVTDEAILLEFFESASESAMIAIKGIAQKTAAEIVQARPLTWEALDEILSDRLIEESLAHIKDLD